MSEYKDRPRSSAQNRYLHDLCGDVAKQKSWAGRRRSTEDWKRIFTDAWAREEGLSPGEVVPSLNGEGVVILNISTRKLNVRQMADLITWILAYCDTEGVRLSAPEQYAEYREAAA